MNIFEDFVEELKNENLLENTVMNKENGSPKDSDYDLNVEQVSRNVDETSNEVSNLENQTALFVEEDSEEINSVEENANAEEVETKLSDANLSDLSDDPKVENVVAEETETETDFFKQRAIDEVTGLQMVEHVLSGIEREQMKSASAAYNDIKVKQALHNFLKIEDIKSPEHAQAEFQLMQETEDWYSSLSRRDRNIVVGQFRRFCEQTKPALSSRALMSLARFYRNSPYSESVRSKYDLTVTRLFTKESGNEKRQMLFNKEEITQHLKELYADWSSIPLYSLEEDDSEILLCILQFHEFIEEVQNAETFNELIKTDFFKRVKVFKEKTSENFFSPQLVSASIECNVAVGNKYIELIEKERNKANFGDKYGVLHDESISEATGKTLELLELIKEKIPAKTEAESSDDNISQNQNNELSEDSEMPEKSDSANTVEKSNPFKVNKWLLICTIIIVTFAAVFHYNRLSSVTEGENTDVLPTGVKRVNIERSFLKDHMNEVRVTNATLFAISKPSWNLLEKTEKENYLRKIMSLGKEKDFKKVMIIDEKGKVLASASEEKIELLQ